MSNLNAHIKKSHGLSWKEAEQQYGVSAKTGEMLDEDHKIGAPWENPHRAHADNIDQRDEVVGDQRITVQKSEYEGMIGHSINQ